MITSILSLKLCPMLFCLLLALGVSSEVARPHDICFVNKIHIRKCRTRVLSNQRRLATELLALVTVLVTVILVWILEFPADHSNFWWYSPPGFCSASIDAITLLFSKDSRPSALCQRETLIDWIVPGKGGFQDHIFFNYTSPVVSLCP